MLRKIKLQIKIYTKLIKRRSKVHEKICHVNILQILTNEKDFSEVINQYEVDIIKHKLVFKIT